MIPTKQWGDFGIRAWHEQGTDGRIRSVGVCTGLRSARIAHRPVGCYGVGG
ncbi:MAG TPA: hypothetical protein PLJ27_14300 [Polyangiaceae bacterium]|nr:hypothetical protein [Polyangiaceae bacterium]HNZ21790.1 hypothetical protein [Polyangiaceae bacterium]HOD23486.1 hypothetical protein [Polyangiaceae bacterium]HOE51505.1 hypothetical protein [Polyangiaceae bacterium]HOG99649.1 hypothetical protein [Polyangiaceae bacterium]